MNWFKKIIGTEKVINNVFDKDKGLLTQVGQWVGHQQFTEEERAKFDASMGEAVQKFSIATMNENTERSKTRRDLANKWFDMHLMFIRLTALCIFLDWLIVKFTDAAEYELTSRIMAITFDPWLWAVTSGIGAFFWGTHALRSSKHAKND